MWYVYLLKCSDNSFYTGVTQDIERRIFEHNNDNKRGAKYVWSRRPAVLIYKQEVKTRSLALRKELEIKGWSRKKKIALVGPDWSSPKVND